jgi:hypothetical protein
MRVRRLFIALVVVLSGLVAVPATASAKGPPAGNPAEFCRATNNADGYLASHGGCVSSVASIGVDALMAGAFPSQAAAVATCKLIAESYGGFPFAFYGNVGNPAYTATNIRSCVDILYLFHTGQLPPGPQS